MNIHNKLAA